MRYSKTLIPTLREVTSEAESISHRLLLKAGYVRQLASGLYIYLPLGWRVLNKINQILREEMNRIGAQEITMTVLHPAEVWQKTGRWYEIKDEMFRLKDRTGRDLCLAMTHEEIMTWLAAKEIKSYRELPQIWYQIQIKLRDEARPKSGILRTKEFVMKDSYSFDLNEEGLEKSYKLHEAAYHRIFKRCGLRFYQVESDPGMMGGGEAHEFMAPSDAGEDRVVLCDSCRYAANIELAVSVSKAPEFQDLPYEEVYTPEKRTVEEVSTFLGMTSEHFIKSLLLIADGRPVLALIRGDQELHERKVQKIIGHFRPAQREEVERILGVEAGFIGPMGHNIYTIADDTIKGGVYISGANKKDYHAKGIKSDVHFDAEWHDIHIAKEDEKCPKCEYPLRIEKAIEIGNIFKLGTKYAIPLHAMYLNENGEEVPIIMGSYGIGPARIAAACIEQNHDDDGIIWPESIAPFDVQIIPLNMTDEQTVSLSEKLYDELNRNGIDVLIDDRQERAGIKFKDADLIGVPYQVVLGVRNLKEGFVEIKNRRTGETERVKIEKVVEKIRELVNISLNNNESIPAL